MGNATMSVLVTGFFDLLHSGHVRFLERAAEFGPVTVVVGSDDNSLHLKGRLPLCREDERLYMVRSLGVVSHAVLDEELGRLGFASEMRRCKPKYFVINADGDDVEKRKLCEEQGVEYVVLERLPATGLPARSTVAWRDEIPKLPYKIGIGGFVDQPKIGNVHPGSVIVISIEADAELDRFSGLATSTRDLTLDLFGPRLPAWMTPQRLAEIIFACENPPSRKHLSGTMDPLGLFFPGVSRLDYANGEYWPVSTERLVDDVNLDWLQSVLYLAQTRRRPPGMPSPMDTAKPTKENIGRMDSAVRKAFSAMQEMNAPMLGQALTECYLACTEIIPAFAPPHVQQALESLQEQYLGAGLTGAGGGGYAVVISESPPQEGMGVRIRRQEA